VLGALALSVVSSGMASAATSQKSHIVPGGNGVFKALNDVREARGLPPAGGWGTSAPALGVYPQKCALHWGTVHAGGSLHCGTNEVETGTTKLSGAQAVKLWMGDKAHRAIILEAMVLKVYVGWAWLAPSNQTGAGGYVVVMDVCAATPGNQPNCP
jgi:hypothetical protein